MINPLKINTIITENTVEPVAERAINTMNEVRDRENRDNYEDYVELLASEGINQSFYNSSAQHAAIVMSRIFKYSKEVRIFCEGFTGQVSNNPAYLSELYNYLLKPNNRLVVVAENYEGNKDNTVFSILRTFYKNGINKNISVYQTQDKIMLLNTNKDKMPVHFSVGDDNKFRIETDIAQFTARANFNSPNEAAPLISSFEELINSSNSRKIDLRA